MNKTRRATWTRALPVPTGRLVAIAAAMSLVAALVPLPTLPVLLALNAALAAVVVLDSRLAVPPSSLEVRREVAAVIPLGREGAVSWTLENRSARAARVEFEDWLAPSLSPQARRVRLTVPARGSARADTTLRPQRRGRFRIDWLTLRVTGPARLGARQEDVPAASTVRVYPSFASRDEAELRVNRARILEVGFHSAQGHGGGTDFDALREYGDDDQFRRIDWAATARVGKPMVRTYRAERNQTLLLMLDTGRVMAGRIGGVPRLDHAMDAVMMLTTVATRLGDRAGLVAFDVDVRSVVAPSHGRAQVGRVTEAMYELDPRLVESDYVLAFTTALARFRRRTMLVVLTDLAEQAIQETLLPALPLVARDHLVVVASVRDPEVDAWSRDAGPAAAAVFRRAASVAALEERRRVAVQLRGMGVTVVDAPPAALATELADAYLRVKATGRL